MTTEEQNPDACTDGNCILRNPLKPEGMHTNGGCYCITTHLSTKQIIKLRRGIRWLADHLTDHLLEALQHDD